MKLTKHGEIRMNKRGIRIGDMRIVFENGTDIDEYVCFLSEDDMANQIGEINFLIERLERARPEGWREEVSRLAKRKQRYDKIRGKNVVRDEDRVVTAFQADNKKKRDARIRRGRRKGFKI